MDQIKIVLGDITEMETQAIVNAANTSLLGGGGVDGAIHRAAGPELLEACKKLGGCDVGEAKITQGFRLKAQFVIHTVGPIWEGGNQQEAEKLANCYQNSLALGLKQGIRQIAFPCISTGVYGYPLKEACHIAFHEVYQFLNAHPEMEEVVFVCFSQEAYDIYKQMLKLFKGEAFRAEMEERLKAGEHHTWMVKDHNRLFQNEE